MRILKKEWYDSDKTYCGSERINLYINNDNKKNHLDAKLCALKDISEEKKKEKNIEKSKIIKEHYRVNSFKRRLKKAPSKVELSLFFLRLELKDAEAQGYKLI